MRRDAEKLLSGQQSNRVVYDCMDPSPYYEGEAYLEDKDLFELPPLIPEEQLLSGEVKKQNFNLSTQVKPLDQMGQPKALPKVNKIYSKLKPYYPMPKPARFVDDEPSVVRLPEDETLVFESRFESGNLRRAVQVGEYEYDLILKYDYGTNNYTQWYYFGVKNTRKDVRYKFNIINLIKPESSYNQGMKPLMYSAKD